MGRIISKSKCAPAGCRMGRECPTNEDLAPPGIILGLEMSMATNIKSPPGIMNWRYRFKFFYPQGTPAGAFFDFSLPIRHLLPIHDPIRGQILRFLDLYP